jgi:hypothetical protein
MTMVLSDNLSKAIAIDRQGQQQIPSGDDNKKGKSKNGTAVRFAQNDEVRRRRREAKQRQQQIPFGDDNKKDRCDWRSDRCDWAQTDATALRMMAERWVSLWG